MSRRHHHTHDSANGNGARPFRPYEIEEGTPTITFTTAERSLALPYHHLQEMQLAERGTHLAIRFTDYQIQIDGSALRPLWRELQLFNVREVEASPGAAREIAPSNGATAIQRIAIARVEFAEEEEAR